MGGSTQSSAAASSRFAAHARASPSRSRLMSLRATTASISASSRAARTGSAGTGPRRMCSTSWAIVQRRSACSIRLSSVTVRSRKSVSPMIWDGRAPQRSVQSVRVRNSRQG